jgi:hypothetical protein
MALQPFPAPLPTQHAYIEHQPQWYATHTLAGEQKEARKYTAKDWDAQRSEILRLYKNGTLKSVMKFMRERHGLDAT